MTAPLPLGDLDGSGLEGTAVAPCDPSSDGTADRQIIVCRSGYKNQAMHLQVLGLPSVASVAAAVVEEEASRHRTRSSPGSAATGAATPTTDICTALLTPREVANVYTTVPIHQIA